MKLHFQEEVTLGINAQNELVNGVGDLVLSDGLEPIILPNFTSMSITDIGEVLVQQAGAPDGELTSVGFIGSTSAEIDQLIKSLDGNIRKADGSVPDADQTARFGQGFLSQMLVPLKSLLEILTCSVNLRSM